MSEAYAPLTVSFPSYDGQPSVSVRADDPTDLAAKLGALQQVFAAAAAADQARRGGQPQAPQQQAPPEPQQPAQQGWGAPPQQPAQGGYQYQQPPQGQTYQQQAPPQQGGGYPEDPGKDAALAKLGGVVPSCPHGQKVWKNPPNKKWKGFFCPAKEQTGPCSANWDND